MAAHHDGGWDLLKALGTGLVGGGLLKAWELFRDWRKAKREEKKDETAQQVAVRRLELDDEREDRQTAREIRDELRQDVRDLRAEVGTLRERVAVLEGEKQEDKRVIAEWEKRSAIQAQQIEAQEHALKTAALNANTLQTQILDLQKTVADRTRERDDLISELARVRSGRTA